MMIYLDNCCFNRPYDDQRQLRIRLETEAKLAVQALMKNGDVKYAWSDMLDAEIAKSPYHDRRAKIIPWRANANRVIHVTQEVEDKAKFFEEMGIKPADSLHIACAVCAECDLFLTVDRGILKKLDHVGKMLIIDPLDYIQDSQ